MEDWGVELFEMLTKKEELVAVLALPPVANHLHSVKRKPENKVFECETCGASVSYEELDE